MALAGASGHRALGRLSDPVPVGPTGTSERRRVEVCGAAGAAVGVVLALLTPWQLAVLAGWVTTAVVLIVWVWVEVGGLDAESTAQVATREDDSRSAARWVLVVACVMSLLAVVAALHRASRAPVGLAVALTAASLLAVVLSWLVVSTVFVLRYAHLYYRGGEAGGIEFPGSAAPSYRDFAYVGFTIGMTYQVSDTAIADPVMRATVLRHALLSFLFSVSIITLTINVIAQLV